jgi:hypothetical protein
MYQTDTLEFGANVSRHANAAIFLGLAATALRLACAKAWRLWAPAAG